MACFECNKKFALGTFLVLCTLQLAASSSNNQYNRQQHGTYQPQNKGVYNHDFNWPITFTYSETKTNEMLGEALLKRLYARIGFTDNIIRAEIDTLYEKLKDLLEKRIRKCERRRRRAGRTSSNYESFYSNSALNASLANQYTPRARSYYGLREKTVNVV